MKYALLITLNFYLFCFNTYATCKPDQVVKDQYIVKVHDPQNTFQKTSDTSFSIKSIVKKTTSSKVADTFKTTNDADEDFGKKKYEQNDQYNDEQTLVIETKNIDSFNKTYKPSYVQQDCFVKPFIETSDSLAVFQDWYLSSINADDIEDFLTQKKVVVAVVDTGVDIEHEDLVDNIWTNQAELNGRRGVDDDLNGYIDDIYGYDIADGDNDPKPQSSDIFIDADHGTHIAGLIGATFNNEIGVYGVAKNNIKIMAVKGFKSLDPTPLSDLLKAVYYAIDNGAEIINASWGSLKEAEQAELDLVNYALSRKVIIVAAAGNTNQPASWITPASVDGVVTVSSVNSENQLSTFSNYGDKVDFLAPGGDGQERLDEVLLSTTLNNSFDSFSGTSMSAPLVSGSLALLMSYKSDVNAFKALRALTSTAETKSLVNFRGQNETEYKLLNVKRALNYVQTFDDITELNPLDFNTGSVLNTESDQALEAEETASNNRLSQIGSGGCSSVRSRVSAFVGTDLDSAISFNGTPSRISTTTKYRSNLSSVQKSQGHPLVVTFMFLLPLLTNILKRMF